jgi:hypothetical protein
MINRHFPDSTETLKGCLKGQWQGIRPAKQKTLDKFVKLATTKIKQETDNSAPAPTARYYNIFIKVEDLSKCFHTDQTGGFPFTSHSANRYIMTVIHLDANYIFVEAMIKRTQEEMMDAYQQVVDRMRAAGLGLKKHILDNKASKVLKRSSTRWTWSMS